MKTLDQIALGILIPFALVIGAGILLFFLQEGINNLIEYTPRAKVWQECINSHGEEIMKASTTAIYLQIEKECGKDPRVHVIF